MAKTGITSRAKDYAQWYLDIVREAGGKIVDHWGEFDAMGLLRQIGAIPRLRDTP